MTSTDQLAVSKGEGIVGEWDRARARVAANPGDEQAAEELFELVSRTVGELPESSSEAPAAHPQVVEASRLLLTWLESSDEQLRAACTWALGAIGRPEFMPVLQQLRTDRHPSVRWNALRSLRALHIALDGVTERR